MKHFNLKLALAIIFSLFSFLTIAQNFWQKGGNAQVPPAAPSIIGTDNTWNAPLIFYTNGTERLHINENTGTTAGFVGIGTNLPQSQLHINDGTYATFQMTNATTGANANDGFKLAVNKPDKKV